jgi:thioredoxin reductase (NADPH)
MFRAVRNKHRNRLLLTMLNPSPRHDRDVGIVGGGPAGLAAAVYLGRFLRSVIVFDDGNARAKLIPKTHNCPGFPRGISGQDLLGRLRDQAKTYGAKIVDARVERVEKLRDSFILHTAAGVVSAARVILATGIVDTMPAIPRLQEAITTGAVRLCPVCDAYEVVGQHIGVVGPEELALKEAMFLKHYSPQVVTLFKNSGDISSAGRKKAVEAGIEIWDGIDDLIAEVAQIRTSSADGSTKREIDVLYIAMGCEVRSELAIALGAECDEDGYLVVGNHLGTSVRGLYAIGDVAKALNQIAVGFGHAALAAAHIHHALLHQGEGD